MIEEIKKIFIEETDTDLKIIRAELVKESASSGLSISVLEKVFRTMHTIKGSAPMFGFPHLTKIANPVARAFEIFSKSDNCIGAQVIEKTTNAIDILQEALHSDEEHLPGSAEEHLMMVDYFNDICKTNQEADD